MSDEAAKYPLTILFGGSFDPVHWGHLHSARAAMRELSATSVLFIPAHVSPHKTAGAKSGAEDRLNMLRLAIVNEPGFAISELELRRPPPSYTWETVRTLFKMRTGEEFVFLIGADQLSAFHKWKHVNELIKVVRFAILPRPGWEMPIAVPMGRSREMWRKFCPLHTADSPISSTDIRQRVANGQSIDALVPAAVRDYIVYRGLYRAVRGG